MRGRDEKEKTKNGRYRIGTHRLGSAGRPSLAVSYEFTGDITILSA